MSTNELYPDNFQDVKKALVVQNAINVLPVVFAQLFYPELLGLFVFLLEFL